jgi:hypothetical protein
LAERAEAVPELQGRDFVFFVGNAFVYKNLHRLMDAVAVIPNIVLAIAGKRDFYYEQLILYARGLGYSNVEFPALSAMPSWSGCIKTRKCTSSPRYPRASA